MKKISDTELKAIIYKHAKWARGEDGGERADLCGADLRSADLRGADLHDANLHDADLRSADLRGANLHGADLYNADLHDANLHDAILYNADLRSADLRSADLHDANLYNADLCDADLRGANLRSADLRSADLHDANLYDARNVDKVAWDTHTAFYPLQCPGTGSFIGYKKAAGKIVMLEICADAKRSSATSRKCRCSKAKVLSITNLDGSDSGLTEVRSNYSKEFVYCVGEIVEAPDFDENRWNECTAGIHFFITREEALKY